MSLDFERLRNVLTASGSIAYEWDVVEDTIAWFDGAVEAFGIASIDSVATGKRFNELVCPDDTAYRDQALALIYKGAEDYEIDYRVRYKMIDIDQHRRCHCKPRPAKVFPEKNSGHRGRDQEVQEQVNDWPDHADCSRY